MSRLPRPHISDSIKVEVVLRQLQSYGASGSMTTRDKGERLADFLERLLMGIATYMECPRDQLRLDHEPALENRVKMFKNGVHVEYYPPAGHPDWLAYRPHGPEFAGSHLVKTNVHGDHGQHSDRALAAKNKNIARNRDPNRRKAKIKSANRWPAKGSQKIQNRKMQ